MIRSIKALMIFLSSISVIIYSGCSDDDPITPAEDHFEAVGVYLSNSGIKLASIFKGETSDTLFATAGELSDHIEVQFYNDNQEIIDPPADPDHTLGYEISDTTVAVVYQHQGEEGGYEFHIQGKKAGLTQLELFIVHEGHNDFRSGKFPVVVK